jgi:hypothetical protein
MQPKRSKGCKSLNKSEAAPRLSSGHRVRRIRRQHCNERHHSRRSWMNDFDRWRCLDREHADHRRSWLDTRCRFVAITYAIAARAAGAPRMRGSRLAVVMQLASAGGVEPRPFGFPSNDLTGRRNRGSRTLDTAVMSCLLCPTELHCSGGHGPSDAGTHRQQRCRVPVWFEPQPLAPNDDQDLGDDARTCRTSKFVRDERHGCAAQPYSSLVVMTIGTIVVPGFQAAVLESPAGVARAEVIST